MKNLVYLSTSRTLLSDEVLLDILASARKNNQKHNITGVLLYSEGTFIQVLEGEDDDVDETFATISKDIRHKNIVVMLNEPTDKRSFPSWSMGFNSVDPTISEEFIESLTSSDKLLTIDGNSITITMVQAFIENNRLVINH